MPHPHPHSHPHPHPHPHPVGKLIPCRYCFMTLNHRQVTVLFLAPTVVTSTPVRCAYLYYLGLASPADHARSRHVRFSYRRHPKHIAANVSLAEVAVIAQCTYIQRVPCGPPATQQQRDGPPPRTSAQPMPWF